MIISAHVHVIPCQLCKIKRKALDNLKCRLKHLFFVHSVLISPRPLRSSFFAIDFTVLVQIWFIHFSIPILLINIKSGGIFGNFISDFTWLQKECRDRFQLSNFVYFFLLYHSKCNHQIIIVVQNVVSGFPEGGVSQPEFNIFTTLC